MLFTYLLGKLETFIFSQVVKSGQTRHADLPIFSGNPLPKFSKKQESSTLP